MEQSGQQIEEEASRRQESKLRARMKKTHAQQAQQIPSWSGQGAVRPSSQTRRTLCNQEMLEETGKTHAHRREEYREIGQEALHQGVVEFQAGPARRRQIALVGCKETRESAAHELIVWAGVVLSSYSRTLMKELCLSRTQTVLRDWLCRRRTDVRGEPLTLLGYQIQGKVHTDATSARAIAVREESLLRPSTKGTTEGERRHVPRSTVPGKDNRADIGTKYSKGDDAQRFSEWINLKDEEKSEEFQEKRQQETKVRDTLWNDNSADNRRHAILRSNLMTASVPSVKAHMNIGETSHMMLVLNDMAETG